MSLYTQAESNINKTWAYLTFFLIFIIFIGWIISYIFDSYAIMLIAVIYSVAISFVSYWYSDKIVLAMTRAKPIEKKDNPELYRLVENLCITAGLPLPKIYVMNEAQPNAFATGRDQKHAVVAVTSGLLERLDKSELEGVIAHELSHIGNRDTLLQTIVVVLVGVVVMMVDLAFRARWYGGSSRSSSRDRGGAGAIIAVLGLVALILAPILAQLIKFAISRKREFLADASGALLTRYPEGLARALEKISKDPTPLARANNATSHLYIVNPFRGGKVAKLFMTHPPIEERISALRGMQI